VEVKAGQSKDKLVVNVNAKESVGDIVSCVGHFIEFVVSKPEIPVTVAAVPTIDPFRLMMDNQHLCCVALGIEDGTIHSDQLTASSEFRSSKSLGADRGRLNTVSDEGGFGCWAAATNDPDQWIQADLGAIKGVIGVITQGRSDGTQWVTSYKVQYSTDGSVFLPVLGSSGQVEIFSANSDANTEVRNIFSSVVCAQFIRINPITWYRHISLRFELLGTDSVVALGIEDETIHSDQLTASSEYLSSKSLGADRGRLNTVSDAGGFGAWAAATNDRDQWIQADLGSVKRVVGVITQGRSGYNQWVKTYKVNYSTDGSIFAPVLGSSGQVEIFSANSDRNTEVKNIFSSVVYAQFIRINPITWYRHISLRFELLGTASLDLDITLYSSTPLTLPNNANEFRGYAINNCRTTDLTIGILYKVVDGKENLTWSDTGYSGNNNDDTGEQLKDMPDNKIFNTGSEISYRVHNNFVYLGVKNLPNPESDGVFSFIATTSKMVSSAAIVVTSSLATIKMQFRTMTVGIGESATISLSENGGFNDLHWRHNYGDVIQMWNGNSSVTIENIRAKDDGVYECYRSGSPSDNRGVMRLIVRDCPLPKWSPPECEIDCPVCYNGGVCDDKTGLCICPAGFKGEYCQTSCGSNNWGRNCDVVCSTGDDEGCKGKLFCPPDPFGCTCIDGYGGNDCNTECDNNHYGADCRQVCHCDSGGCDRKTGDCTSGSSCSTNYTGPACQELLQDQSCPSGFFGVLCNYPCHCKDSADCNRNGSCGNGCHEAWAGEDCSIALPYSSKPPTPLNETATTIHIPCSWDPLLDFGTGTITGCKLWYNTSSTSTFIDIIANGVYIIDNLTLHTTVEFYVQYSRLVGGVETDGPPSEHGSAETICTKPLEDPEIELETVDGNDIILTLKPVSNAPERIQCDDILRYQVRYQSKDGNEQDILNTTDSLQTEVKISELSPCVFYHVDSRVVNNAEITGDWGTPISVQSAPSAPSVTKDSVLEGTFLLMKWNTATCNSTQNNLSYHYELSGGVHQGSTTKTEVLINDGIVPCTQYTFSVFASYMNVSSITDIMEFMSGVDYPGKPTISSLTSTSSSITLELTLSDDNPCTILGYNVLVYSDIQNLEFNIDTTATSLTINENIMPSTIYNVQAEVVIKIIEKNVAAKTQKGFGNFSDVGYVSTDAESGIGGIVGGVIGGLSAAISIVFALIFVKRRRNSSNEVVRPAAVQKQGVFDTENELMPAVEGHANVVDVRSPDDEDDGAPPIENVYANSEPVYGNTNLENQEYRPIELARLHNYGTGQITAEIIFTYN
ncbi:uncharacterized protein LOC117121804, partial [Anneissia japonica]|uniref:uncharacterized protein LOC117121804 n=1 Tax=Anneissia japonica TaxID=1529436 RepID=UPI00142589C9